MSSDVNPKSSIRKSPISHFVSSRRTLRQRIPLKILGKKWSKTSRLVASSKVLRNAIPTQNCDIIMTLPATTGDMTLMWLLSRLRARTPQIHVHVRHWKNTGVYAFYMTANFDNLLKGAEEFGILKSLKSELGSGHREFLYEEQSCFERIEDEDSFFTSQERQCIVYNMLLNLRAISGETLGNVKFLEGQSIVPLLQSHNIISQVFPLHDTSSRKDLRKTWVTSLFKRQPLEDVCDYFGVKIAMYFAYLGHYTSALIVPTVVGIVFWFIQNDSQLMEDLCFVTFALFNVFWATVYIELWLRRSSELAYKWGTLDKKGELLQEPRPLYTGYCTISPVTGRVEPVYPSWKRNLFRYCVSLPVIMFCLFLVFCIMLLIFQIQEWINNLVKGEHIPSMCSYLPKILLALAIWVMDEIYKKVATWLNDKENYRMEETYENHLIIKLVLFQFVNSFLSLFYIAFYLQDMDRLRDQLATLLITRQVIGNIREALVPYLLWKAKLIKVGYNITGNMSPHSLEKEIKDMTSDKTVGDKDHTDKEPTSDTEEDSPYKVEDSPDRVGESPDRVEDSPHDMTEEVKSEVRRQSVCLGNISPLILTQAEVESTMKKYEDTFDDHLEMFIQYGYVILFSSAFPLAALCAFLNNMIEIRSDAFKLCVHHQRPFGKRVNNIGTWLDALRVMGVIAVIVNSALIGVSGQVSRMYTELDTKSTFILIVSLEHVILALKTCIAYAIPSRPEWIDGEMARWEFRRREAVKSVDGSPLDMMTPQPFPPSPTTGLISPTLRYTSTTIKTPQVPVRRNVSNIDSIKQKFESAQKQAPNPFFPPINSVSAEKVKCQGHEETCTVQGHHIKGPEKHDDVQEQKVKGHVSFKEPDELDDRVLDSFQDITDFDQQEESKERSENSQSSKFTMLRRRFNDSKSDSDDITGDPKLGEKNTSEKHVTWKELSSERQFSDVSGTSKTTSVRKIPGIERHYTSEADYQARMETKRKILLAAKTRESAGIAPGGRTIKSSRTTDL